MDIHALVVDDSGIMRKLVMRSLLETKLAQFTFTEAKDGAEALALFDGDRINMIFVDWNMPNMNGIDLVRQVRATQKRHVPVIMITTESTIAKVEEALDQAGVDCFVVKPFTTEILLKKLEPLFVSLQAAARKPTGFFGRLANKLN